MPKIAILISFVPMTRLVVELPEDKTIDNLENTPEVFDRIVSHARAKMHKSLEDYLNGDNVDIFTEDFDCPIEENEKPAVNLSEKDFL